MIKLNLDKTSIIQITILLILTMAIFLPITLVEVAYHDITDYPTFIDIARDISANPKYWSEQSSNPGWTMMLLAVKEIFAVKHWKAALIVQLAHQGFLALALFFLAKGAVPPSKRWLPVALPLGLMLAAPFFLLALKDQRLYFGYIGINSYHNPTIFALKPYALVLFSFTALALEAKNLTPFLRVFCFLMAAAAALVKPSFSICLLPAAGIIFLARWVGRQKFGWKTIILSVFLPTILVLAYEYLSTYTSSDVSVVVSPFIAMKNLSDHLLVKFLLSIWFPLSIVIAYWEEVLHHFQLKFAWLVFFFGVVYTYLLAEGGWRIAHGNFTWSGEISLFVLFVISALFLFEQLKSKPASRKWTLVLVAGLLPHLVCGVIYYGYCLLNNIYF